jgi:hypothetical protein
MMNDVKNDVETYLILPRAFYYRLGDLRVLGDADFVLGDADFVLGDADFVLGARLIVCTNEGLVCLHIVIGILQLGDRLVAVHLQVRINFLAGLG